MSIHQPTPKENPLPEEIQNYIKYLEEQINNIREEVMTIAKQEEKNIQKLPESQKNKTTEDIITKLEPYKHFADKLKLLIKIIKHDNGQRQIFTETEKYKIDNLNQEELKTIIEDEKLSILEKMEAVKKYEEFYNQSQI